MNTGTLIISCAVLLLATVPKSESCQDGNQRFRFPNSDIYLRLSRSTKLQYQILKGSEILQSITFDNFYTDKTFQRTAEGSYILTDGVTTVDFKLVSTTAEVTHVVVSRSNVMRSTQPMDCIDLDIGHTHWFAGPEDVNQYWPLERHMFSNYSYLTKEDQHAAIAERYWLNSKGVFLYVETQTPLFIEQNSAGYENQLCLRARSALPYNVRVKDVSFVYHIGIGRDAKRAHMYAVQKILGTPTGVPDERMVRHPIWSTWALYKAEINDSVVREFGNNILTYGFNNSQLEIDDDWEDCYGALTFRKNKFPDIKKLTDDLKAQGFRVTLWIHPFINKNCTSIYNEAKSKDYLVTNHNGNSDTKWWNSIANDAAFIDFTKLEVQEWFSQRIRRLQTEDGIDSFKFDAGETSWIPSDPVLQGELDNSPHQITQDFVRTVGAFGPMIEVRTGQGTQDLPVFVRMLDKDSEWGWNNGLVTLIPTLLQRNLNGYPFVLPDMIGGNGYNERPPNRELFLRWLQANVFMPTLQFSFVPWNFDEEIITLSKKFTALHSQYAPYIMKRFNLAVNTGEPVNIPLWWIDPTDNVAQSIYDEFLLGDDIIAAPVVVEGAATRDIYLPKGEWIDGNTNKIINGPTWLMDYPAPLDTLPYFLRRGVTFDGN